MLYHDFAKDCPGSFKATLGDKTRPFHSSSALLDAKALPSPKRKKHKFSSGLIVIQTSKFATITATITPLKCCYNVIYYLKLLLNCNNIFCM